MRKRSFDDVFEEWLGEATKEEALEVFRRFESYMRIAHGVGVKPKIGRPANGKSAQPTLPLETK